MMCLEQFLFDDYMRMFLSVNVKEFGNAPVGLLAGFVLEMGD